MSDKFEKEMLIEDISQLLNKRALQEFGILKDENRKLSNQLTDIYVENHELESQVEKLNDKINNIQFFNGLLDDIVENSSLQQLIDLLGWKEDNYVSQQFDDAPEWFLVYCRYYSKKEELKKIFSMYGIEPDIDINEFRMPYEWNKDELLTFCIYIANAYVTNGQIFSNNYGFWYRRLLYNIDPDQQIRYQYNQIPWQLILKNPLWNQDEECFDKMMEIISNKKMANNYFFNIVKYQEMDEEKAERLAGKINKLNKMEKAFLECYFPKSEENLNRLFKKASSNQYNSLYIGKFPKSYQFRWVINIEDINDVFTKTKLLKFTDDEINEVLRLRVLS